jgi:hypothetical protein
MARARTGAAKGETSQMSSQIKIEFCGHCKNQRLTPERRAELRAEFEKWNTQGAKRFDAQWLRAMSSAIDAARSLSLDVTDPRIRALLTRACYFVLDRLETK